MAGRLMQVKQRARGLKQEIIALNFAVQDPRTPRRAKWLGIAVIGYALSPIDLIPDFIPVFGLLDDLILVPIGLLVLRRMIPSEVMTEARAKAVDAAPLPKRVEAAVGIVVLWLAILILIVWLYVLRR